MRPIYNGRVIVDMFIDAGTDTNVQLVATDDCRLKVAKLRLGAILDKRVNTEARDDLYGFHPFIIYV